MTRSLPPPSAENWLSRAEYRRILRGQILPDSVIATKSTSKSDHWREGHKRDILHQCWLISTDDRDVKKDNAVFQIDFDRCVDVNGVRLSDDTRLNDNLTKKISCITLLVIGYGKHKLNAQSVRAICDYFDWMVRWRLSLYINCISDIMESDFHNFLELASVNDITSLVPLADRLDWLVSEVENGQFRLPLALTENKSLTLNWTALSEKLGVTRRGLAASLEFRSELIDRLYSLDSINSAYLAANLALPPPGCDVPRSVRSVRGLLETWYCVSIFSKMGLLNHDPLTFDPFKQRTMLSFAKENGHEGIRTLTLLPDDFLGVLNAAATWVLDFAPHILRVIQLSEEVSSRNLSSHYDKLARQRLAEEMDANAPAGMPMIWPSLRFAAMEAKTSRLDLRTVVRYLMTACAILIMGFGARRIGEVTSLRTGCLIEEKPHLCDLSVYIEKTLRDIDRIPVPILIKSVIAILESLTAASRSDTGKQWLFEIVRTTDSGKQVYLHLEFRKLLNLFPLVNGLATPNGWEQWVLKAHQLRRGFAISYYHGNLAASLDALSRFLRHFDPEVTRIYISESLPGLIGRLREEISARTKVGLTTLSDEDKRWLSNTKDLLADLEARGQIFDEVRCEHTVYRMLRMWEGFETPIGRGAAKLYGDLNGMVDKATAGIRVGSRANSHDAVREPLINLIQEYAKTNFLEPVPGRVAHCVCRPGHAEDLAEAECLKAKAASQRPWAESATANDVKADFAFSGAYICLTCKHCAAFNDDQAALGRISESYRDSTVRGATPAAKEAAATALTKFKAALNCAETAVRHGE